MHHSAQSHGTNMTAMVLPVVLISVVIGRIAGVHWSAVITYRDGRVRLISVRRSRAEEVALYESQEF